MALGANSYTTSDNQIALGDDLITQLHLFGIRFASVSNAGSMYIAGADNLISSGTANFGVGPDALVAITTGGSNVAIGSQALGATTIGSQNVAVGRSAGSLVVDGSANVFVGQNAGNAAGQKIDAVNSIAIGSGSITTADNQVALGNDGIVELKMFGAPMIRDARGHPPPVEGGPDRQGEVLVPGL
ncbi:hypothetical protein [Blastomonas sp.]|uniref:hypothetical protein n=1 Tax=Blastomonas sp. TaxID=1909299 RepID=UPI00406A8489